MARPIGRDRLLTPVVTLRLFLTQILHGNCAITGLRQLAGLDFAKSSYAEARARLPLMALQSLLTWLHDCAARTMDPVRALLLGQQRILIADGSNFSVPDTPDLRRHFHLPPGVTPGVGYPMGKLMGLLDAATGLFVELLALPLFQHDMRSVIGLHPMLRAGDILLADRAFGTFAHLRLLNRRGVFACTRLHQRRKNVSSGTDRWTRPPRAPAWMSAADFALLPAFLDVRLVRHTVARAGYRTRHLMIVTTLTDAAAWPDERVAALYGQRWDIETCFDHLKTTMGMNALRCQTVDGVRKELAVYLAAYNLVRLAVLRAARAQGVSPRRVSFIDAMRWLAARLLGLRGVGRLIVNPDRTGRSQLRVIRRRYKQYDLLRKPRREMEAEIAA
ncbi:MAG TPA: IS4 family transposase, partial [Steroidobacteraceae bacterium]